MMLETLGEQKAADAIEQSVMYVTGEKLDSLQAGRMGYSTSGVGDLVAEKVAG
jgi:3-isopropylmalate dehydrogenase